MSTKKNLSDKIIAKIMSNPAAMAKKLQSGIYSALLKHKQAGNPVCEWKNNKVVWVSAEHIPVEKHDVSKGDCA